MKSVVMNFVIACLIGTAGCKQTAESDPNMAKRSEDKNTAMNSCELNDSQLRLISVASEFKSVETVDVKSLPESEQAALKNRSVAAKCTSTEVSTLSGVFPSIASRLSEAGNSDASAAAMALTGVGGGVSGVVRTEYIRMPSGSRYLAGYNSDGMMILLQRLLIRRP